MPYFPKVRRFLVGFLCLAFCAPLSWADTPASKKKQDASKQNATKQDAKQEASKAEPKKFIRVKRDAQDEPLTLETSVARYVSKDGVTVDLISAVHVGDLPYYEKLNKQFEQYDALLYELVAPKGTIIPKGGKEKADNPIAMLQQFLKIVLELEGQLEHVDYTKKNFVHADMSPDEIAASIKARGDDTKTILLGILTDLIRQKNLMDQKAKKPSKAAEKLDLGTLLLDPNIGSLLKAILAEQFEDSQSMNGVFGETLTTLLITDRNKAAVKVLKEEIGKGKKKIGIFYGAGHMTDLEKHLTEDLGFKHDSTQWLTAWDIKAKKKDGNNLEEIMKLLNR